MKATRIAQVGAWILFAAAATPAFADDVVKVAVTQRGLWDTSVTEMGQRSGIFKKRGITAEILYTQGGPEAHQAVISGSMEIACGGGIESAIGAFAKGAPLRIIGSEMIGSPDTYWYVLADSPIKSLKEAAGKTISYSQNGSSSHAALLSLLEQYNVDAKPVSTGGHPATLTMAMTKQIDIGRGAAPFGLELVQQGKIRVIARGSEIVARGNQTVRICLANLQTLQNRKDVVARFMQGYRDTLDWMYSDPAALKAYQDFSEISADVMKTARDEYFPKNKVWPDEIKGLDLILADALKNKFISQPLTPEQVKEMIQIPAPVK
ncbi:MAG: NitT/TauT family transport system substrate-binding protein [Alphaproteobacteria bacterium]|jgi:NitT/TauT family transport system substrate-binding protein|nr:NitT/TauT family transport system substrate-binding protein [Alphaproteobacteria bacterium]